MILIYNLWSFIKATKDEGTEVLDKTHIVLSSLLPVTHYRISFSEPKMTSNAVPFHGKLPNPPHYTEFAQKYTHPRGRENRVIKHTGKSGLTPLSPFLDNVPVAERRRKTRLYGYQVGRYHGFTARDLMTLEAYSALNNDQVQNNLQNQIHPLYQKHKWDSSASLPRHYGSLPLGGPYAGHWEVCIQEEE